MQKKSIYGRWNRVRVSQSLFELLVQHPVFRKEPEAINTAQYWLSAIDSVMDGNDRRPVTWFHKDIQNRFRSYSQSYTVFRDALRDLGLVRFTRTYRPPAGWGVHGECKTFEITEKGRNLVADGNEEWLYALLAVGTPTRRKNQLAVSKKKGRRIVPADPIQRIIDEFRHEVKFQPDGLLRKLRSDKTNDHGAFSSALHLLLAFETRKFCKLEVKEGRIYYEFVALPSEYRRFATLDGDPYVATLDIRACHPTFLGRFLHELYQNFMDEALGDEASPEDLALQERLNQVNRNVLANECNTWTQIFTNPEDPRDWIIRKANINVSRDDMKKCLNTWLNGGNEYRRKDDGRRRRQEHKLFDTWFTGRFPEMAKVLAAVGTRKFIGTEITDAYERSLMMDPALYELAQEMGLRLSYEYDGVGVFAETNGAELRAALERLAKFVQERSVELFRVPVVVTIEEFT